MARRLFATLLACALAGISAGCSGGAGSLLPGQTNAHTQKQGAIRVSIKFGAPTTAKAIARGRNYISYSTRGLAMQFVQHGQPISSGTTSTLDVTQGSPNCTTSGNQRQCGWTINNIAPGWTDLQLSLYDAKPTNGSTPAGTLLSKSTVTTTQITGSATATISFTTIDPVVSGAQLSLQPSTLAYAAGATSTTLYIALLDPDRNIIIDDGTGSALDQTLTVSATTSGGNLSSCGGNTSSPIVATTSYTTIPPASGDAINIGTSCLTSSQIAVKYGTTQLATTTLNITNIAAETSLNASLYPYGGGLVSAMASDGKIWTFSSNATESAQSLDPKTGATGTVVTNPGGCCGGVTPSSNVILGSDGDFYFFASGSYQPMVQKFDPSAQTYTSCPLLFPGAGYTSKITSIAQTADGTLWGADGPDAMLVQVPANQVTSNCGGGVPATTIVQMLQPAPPTVTQVADASSTLPATTYNVTIQWHDNTGYSEASPPTTVAVTSGNDLVIASPPNYSGRGSSSSYVDGWYANVDSGSGYVQLNLQDCSAGTGTSPIYLMTTCTIKAPVTSTTTPVPGSGGTPSLPTSIVNENGTIYVSDARAGTILKYASGTFTPLAFAPSLDAYMTNLTALDSDHIAFQEFPGNYGGLYKTGVLELTGNNIADVALAESQEFAAPGGLALAPNGNLYYTSFDASNNVYLEYVKCTCAPNAAPVFNSASSAKQGFQQSATLYNVVPDNTGSLWIPETYSSNASLVRFTP